MTVRSMADRLRRMADALDPMKQPEWWRNGHPRIRALGNMEQNIPEYLVILRHMRDCLVCRTGYKVMTGVEWVIPAALQSEA